MLSIIITTYNNDHKFLKTAITSCLCQDIEKEIILVDDGSEIKINEYIKNILYLNKIKYIKHRENQGLSAARNTGIKNSKYDFYITLDADDFFFENSLKEAMKYIDNENDIFFGNLWNSRGKGYLDVPLGKNGITRDKLLQENQIWCSSIVGKKVWKSIGGYLVRKNSHYEDWNFWCRAFKYGFKFKYVPICIYQHTYREESMLNDLHNKKDFYRNIATMDLQ